MLSGNIFYKRKRRANPPFLAFYTRVSGIAVVGFSLRFL
jgi:hypothetical protein